MSSNLPRRTMRLHHTFVALSLIAALSACPAGQDKSPDAKPPKEPAPATVANPQPHGELRAHGTRRVEGDVSERDEHVPHLALEPR